MTVSSQDLSLYETSAGLQLGLPTSEGEFTITSEWNSASSDDDESVAVTQFGMTQTVGAELVAKDRHKLSLGYTAEMKGGAVISGGAFFSTGVDGYKSRGLSLQYKTSF